MTQEELAKKIRDELLPLSRDCARDCMHDLLLCDTPFHMRIMEEVVAEYCTQLRNGIALDGYTRDTENIS